MPSKVYNLDSIGKVTVTKRKTNRNIRLSIDRDGEIKVSIPIYASYMTGINFAINKSQWIAQNRPDNTRLRSGMVIAKQQVLNFIADSFIAAPKSRITDQAVTIKYPDNLTPEHPVVQKCATNACIRALRRQAEIILPRRLYELANLYNLSYNQVSIKNLRRRWGSCDQKHHIVLNLYLVQLTPELIDYVILHELAHTQALNHGQYFWQQLLSLDPLAKQHRSQIRQFHPGIIHA